MNKRVGCPSERKFPLPRSLVKQKWADAKDWARKLFFCFIIFAFDLFRSCTAVESYQIAKQGALVQWTKVRK